MLGSNVAGKVELVGEGVSSFTIGDSVFGMSSFVSAVPDQAGLQEYAVLAADAVAKTPAGFSDNQVATLPVNVVTALMALFGSTGLGFPSPLLREKSTLEHAPHNLIILGAGASNGRFAVQLAALAGICNIIAIAGPDNKDDLLSMGATHVVNRHLEIDCIVQEIHGLVGKQGATHIYHCHGYNYNLDIALLPPGKHSFLQSVHPVDDEEGLKLKTARPLCKATMIECSNEGLAPHVAGFWAALPRWLCQGKVRPASYRVIHGLEKVDEINAALDGYREGRGPQVVVQI